MVRPADASPTKEFFVRMITRDISLYDCILDLLDNCLDGARRKLAPGGGDNPVIESYSGFYANIYVSSNEFRIEDNCGGISISDAIDYAFQFGRRPDALTEGEFSIGLYGIGMKRAILKIGKGINIYSSTADEAFISSTRYCMLPVATLNGYRLGNELPGPVTIRLLGAWRNMVGMDFVRQALEHLPLGDEGTASG